MAVGDLDNDGRLDAVVSTKNHWLTLLLVGHKSNRDAIGAEIKLATPAGSQTWTVSTAGSYLSSNDKRAHFGLGATTVEIHWPSGIHQILTHVHGDRILRVEEPSASTPPTAAR